MTALTSAAPAVQPISPPGLDEAVSAAWHEAVRRFKRQLLAQTLERTHGNRTHATRALGLQRTYLLRLIHDLDVLLPGAGNEELFRLRIAIEA